MPGESLCSQGAGGPRIDRAWQSPCYSAGPLGFGRLRWGKLRWGREERKSPCATQSRDLYPGSAAAGSKQYTADKRRRRRQGACSPWHPWEQGMPVSISSGVPIGKLRHEECLQFPKAAGTSCDRSQPPAWTSRLRAGALISPTHVARAQVRPAVRMASVPTDVPMSTQGQKNTLGRKHHPCHAEASSPGSPHGWHGHARATGTWPVPEESFKRFCSGTGSPEPPVTSP